MHQSIVVTWLTPEAGGNKEQRGEEDESNAHS